MCVILVQSECLLATIAKRCHKGFQGQEEILLNRLSDTTNV